MNENNPFEPETTEVEVEQSEVQQPEEKWCIVRIPGLRYSILAPIIERMFETRKRTRTIDQLGYIFVKHNPKTLAQELFHLDGAFPLWDCATKKPATLSEKELELFTRLIEETDLNLIILEHDLSFYATGHIPVICIDPPIQGHKGYIVRRNGNRNFVFSLSNTLTLSATNAHKLRFLSEDDYKKAKDNGLI